MAISAPAAGDSRAAIVGNADYGAPVARRRILLRVAIFEQYKDDAANFTRKCRRAFSLSVVRIEEAPVGVYRPISRNDSFTVTSNRRKLLYVAVPVIR